MKPLIYLAHPYGNNPANYDLALKQYNDLTVMMPDMCFVSPIIAFGSAYGLTTYEQGMELCKTLLAKCDAIWITDDGKSRGVDIERQFAINRGMKIKELSLKHCCGQEPEYTQNGQYVNCNICGDFVKDMTGQAVRTWNALADI